MGLNTENAIIEKKTESCKALRRVFESFWLVPVVFCYAFICWLFGSTEAVIVGFALVITCIFLFCKTINNAYALVLYVSFFMQNVDGLFEKTPKSSIALMAISVAVAGTAFLSFVVKTLVQEGKRLKKGKLFYPLLVMDAAFLLGGITRFNVSAFLVTAGISVGIMLLYICALNRTENFGRYLAKLFVAGAAFIAVEIVYAKARGGNIFDGKVWDQRVFFFSAQCLNVASVYLMLGMAGAFSLGVGTKNDAPCFELCLCLMVAIFLSCCRIVMAVASLALVAIYFLLLAYSPRRRKFFIVTVCIACVVIDVVLLSFKEQMFEFIEMISDKLGRGLNGRDKLWEWCVEKFFEYPVFGYGFVADEVPPSLRNNAVLAHNTVLQWLCSLGVVGSAMTVWFYVVKYKFLLKEFSITRAFYIIAIFGIALAGIFDQSPSADAFTFLTPLLLLAGLESSLLKETDKTADIGAAREKVKEKTGRAE